MAQNEEEGIPQIPEPDLRIRLPPMCAKYKRFLHKPIQYSNAKWIRSSPHIPRFQRTAVRPPRRCADSKIVALRARRRR